MSIQECLCTLFRPERTQWVVCRCCWHNSHTTLARCHVENDTYWLHYAEEGHFQDLSLLCSSLYSVIKSIQRGYTTCVHNVRLRPANILFVVFLKGKPKLQHSSFVHDICCLGGLLTQNLKLIKLSNFPSHGTWEWSYMPPYYVSESRNHNSMETPEVKKRTERLLVGRWQGSWIILFYGGQQGQVERHKGCSVPVGGEI